MKQKIWIGILILVLIVTVGGPIVTLRVTEHPWGTSFWSFGLAYGKWHVCLVKGNCIFPGESFVVKDSDGTLYHYVVTEDGLQESPPFSSEECFVRNAEGFFYREPCSK